MGVDHAAHEPQVLREQLAALVHHEHAADVELEAALHLRAVQIERRLRRQVQQRVRLDRALDLDRQRLQRVVPIVRDVAVELAVLVVGDLALRAVPDRLHRVERVLSEADRIGDEVRVALHDLAEQRLAGVVAQRALGVLGLEVERDRGPAGRALGVLDRVRTVPGRHPARRLGLAGLAGDQLDLAGDHERRVEADAELADQLRRHLLPGLHGVEELARAGLRDRADVLHDLRARHPDPVVPDREGALRGVGLELDLERAPTAQLRPGQLLESQLVERVRGVRHQLAQEDVLVGI